MLRRLVTVTVFAALVGSPAAEAQTYSVTCNNLGHSVTGFPPNAVWNGFAVIGLTHWAGGSSPRFARSALNYVGGWPQCSEGLSDPAQRCASTTSDGTTAKATGSKVTFIGGSRWDTYHEWGQPTSYTGGARSVDCPAQPSCPPGYPGCIVSPIVIPTSKLLKHGRGAEIGGLDTAVVFDIDADGIPNTISWPKRGTMLLAIDSNGNGSIDDGSELFGTAGGYAHGFHKLLTLSDAAGGDKNGVVTPDDPIWSQLLLWDDRDRDAQTDPGELKPAGSLLRAIWLAAELSTEVDEHGNRFFVKGQAEFKVRTQRDVNEFGVDPEQVFPIFDVLFVEQP